MYETFSWSTSLLTLGKASSVILVSIEQYFNLILTSISLITNDTHIFSGGKGRGGEKRGEMTQTLYTHMNKRN
jgi:hypothetical protein